MIAIGSVCVVIVIATTYSSSTKEKESYGINDILPGSFEGSNEGYEFARSDELIRKLESIISDANASKDYTHINGLKKNAAVFVRYMDLIPFNDKKLLFLQGHYEACRGWLQYDDCRSVISLALLYYAHKYLDIPLKQAEKAGILRALIHGRQWNKFLAVRMLPLLGTIEDGVLSQILSMLDGDIDAKTGMLIIANLPHVTKSKEAVECYIKVLYESKSMAYEIAVQDCVYFRSHERRICEALFGLLDRHSPGSVNYWLTMHALTVMQGRCGFPIHKILEEAEKEGRLGITDKDVFQDCRRFYIDMLGRLLLQCERGKLHDKILERLKGEEAYDDPDSLLAAIFLQIAGPSEERAVSIKEYLKNAMASGEWESAINIILMSALKRLGDSNIDGIYGAIYEWLERSQCYWLKNVAVYTIPD